MNDDSHKPNESTLEYFIDLMIQVVEKYESFKNEKEKNTYPLQSIVDIIDEEAKSCKSEKLKQLLNILQSKCCQIYADPLQCTKTDHYGNFGHSRFNDFWQGW